MTDVGVYCTKRIFGRVVAAKGIKNVTQVFHSCELQLRTVRTGYQESRGMQRDSEVMADEPSRPKNCIVAIYQNLQPL